LHHVNCCTQRCGALAQQHLGKADDGIHGVRSHGTWWRGTGISAALLLLVAGSVARCCLLVPIVLSGQNFFWTAKRSSRSSKVDHAALLSAIALVHLQQLGILSSKSKALHDQLPIASTPQASGTGTRSPRRRLVAGELGKR